MQIHCTPELIAYLRKKGKSCIAVEVVSAEHSDFDVTELHIHAVDAKTEAFFVNKKNYRSVPAEFGTVLLPPYRLSYDEEITFSLKKVLMFGVIRQTGIRL